MIIVSGCPRSGTSLMMDLLRVAYGEERILGQKFPRERLSAEDLPRGERESDGHYAVRRYLAEQMLAQQLAEQAETHDMNPNGFWECVFTVRGITWAFPLADQLDKLLAEPKDRLTICKIVSQGLANSDPRFIDRIVYMIRHPRAVAKSQERLKRGPRFRGADGRAHFASDGLTVHTPEMFIQVTGLASRWLLRYPQVPVHYVLFDELIERPTETLAALAEFLGGGGDFAAAAAQVEPRLRRSEPEPIPSPLWEDAAFVYDRFMARDYGAVVEYLSDPRRAINRQQRHWFCPRAYRQVTEDDCRLCRGNEQVRANMQRWCESQGGDWRQAPCLFECGFDLDRSDHVSIEQSVASNFWVTGSTEAPATATQQQA